ncbi:hypothetical protein BDU57DRAFT_518390 [Ampelomyces quisqualis]|uniref:Uncharacterized protein n=1 Tax=Ampelomyces quisqualis TaxID=50730 RepID=A0A6A5QKN5_AMPQU|nr:hypothetical protein BDU57DRAFT_518390 [Ampelomyces quisqualis]
MRKAKNHLEEMSSRVALPLSRPLLGLQLHLAAVCRAGTTLTEQIRRSARSECLMNSVKECSRCAISLPASVREASQEDLWCSEV